MDRTADKTKTGQPGPAMIEVWHPCNTKFDDGIKGINPEPGAKPPDHSPYYAALLERHNNKSICIDCGCEFKEQENIRIGKDRKVGQRCAPCYTQYWNERNERMRKANERKISVTGKVGRLDRELAPG